MSCKKSKKKYPPPCPPPCPPRRDDEDCDQMTLPNTTELTTIATPILMISTGDGFSPARSIDVEATVTPTQTTAAKTTATFQLKIDDELINPPIQVVLDDLDGVPNGETRSVTLRATVNVPAGAQVVSLLGSSDKPADLTPSEGGATLRVCTDEN